MAGEILMPALSPTMSGGVLLKWHVKEGDRVAPGDVIAEIETDKTIIEVEAVDEGTVARLVVPEGTENVKVNTVIAVLNAEGDSATTTVPSLAPTPSPEERAAVPLRPPAERSATDNVGRNLASAASTEMNVQALYQPDSYRVQPHDSIRRIIAHRLTESKQTVPHFYLTVDAEIDALLRLRGEINSAAPAASDGRAAWRVSVNDMIIKALALALAAVPEANATWSEGGLLVHKHADIGVAVAIPGGLITPIVRSAERKPLSQISNEMRDYSARARERKLKPEEYQGGSASISNLGMYGIREFAAVINPPQSLILAVGAGIETPVVKDGKVEIATVMTVTLSADHRAVDGAVAAALLKAFRRYIEKPAGSLI